MKLNKRTLLIIGIAVLVVAAYYLHTVYSQKGQEQTQLNEKLTLAQSRLIGIQTEPLSSQQAELESQLSQATSQVEAVKAMLSQPTGSAAVSSIVFEVAKAYGLQVTGMTSPGLVSDELEGLSCSAVSLTVKVEGDVSSLVSFITELNSHLTTGVVESIVITIPGTSSSGNVSAATSSGNVSAATSSGNTSAEIQMVVYTYEGG